MPAQGKLKMLSAVGRATRAPPPPTPRPHGTQLVPVVNLSPIHYFTHVKFKLHFYMIVDIFKPIHSGREQSRESQPNTPASRTDQFMDSSA